MKPTVIYKHRLTGGYVQNPSDPNPETMEEIPNAIFLYCYVVGDWNARTYGRRKIRSKKNYPAYNVFWIPAPGTDMEKLNKILKEGIDRLTAKDGFRLQTRIELQGRGQQVEIQNY